MTYYFISDLHLDFYVSPVFRTIDILRMEFEMPERHKQDPCSNFFYFHGAKYLEKMDDGSIWQAGHTHTAIKREYTDPLGKKHL